MNRTLFGATLVVAGAWSREGAAAKRTRTTESL